MLKIKTRVKGGTKLRRELRKLHALSKQPHQVKVGVPAGSMNYPDGTNLIMVAAANEFGSEKAGIPERSFLRSTVVNKRGVFRKFWRSQNGKQLLTGSKNALKVLNVLGQLAQAEVQKAIVNIDEPPNAASTIARKGSSNPLIASGLLRQSIRYEVDQ